MSTVNIRWNGGEVIQATQEAVAEALWLAGQDAVRRAQDDVPVEYGDLRRSYAVTINVLPDPVAEYDRARAGIEPPNSFPGGAGMVAYVSYNTPYAPWLHENLGWTPRIAGGPKWLEKNVPAAMKRFPAFLLRAMRNRGES